MQRSVLEDFQQSPACSMGSTPTRAVSSSARVVGSARSQDASAVSTSGRLVAPALPSKEPESLLLDTAGLLDAPVGKGSRALLVKIEIENFKSFEKFEVPLYRSGAVCVVGSNAQGKSSILDALLFVLFRSEISDLGCLIRKAEPSPTYCKVSAQFDCEDLGTVVLQRELQDVAGKVICTCRVSSVVSGHQARKVPQKTYRDWISKTLGWDADDLILPQFSLLKACCATSLLEDLPKQLAVLEEKAEPAEVATGPLLKRRRGPAQPAQEQPATVGLGGVRGRMEARLVRQVDEIFREITRQPLDQGMENWGDGGQALVRKLPEGSFAMNVSKERGHAAAGKGVSLASLSEGERDVCAISLLLSSLGVRKNKISGDELPAFVLLDEPDARLDKRHAKALWKFLAGPSGPRQSLILSLNNHKGFESYISLDCLREKR